MRIRIILFLFPLLCAVAAADQPPQRIVSVAPSFTEILYELGLEKQIIGTTNYCDYPPQAQRTEKIGDMLNPNIEKIIALHPDLVFCGAWKWQLPEKLRAIGIHVVELKDADSMETIFERIRTIAEHVGRKEKADSIIEKMKSRIEEIRRQSALLPKKPRVFMELDAGNWTAGGGSYLNEILSIVGADNIFHDRKEPYLMVTTESIASRNPDLIISLNRKKEDYNTASSWQAFRAVREGRIIDKDDLDWNAIMRQSGRLAEGISALQTLVRQTSQ
jgi:iron complex transport system substrate-binding protein